MRNFPIGFTSPHDSAARLSAYSMDMAAVHGGLVYAGERELVIRVTSGAISSLRQRRLWSVRLEHAASVVAEVETIRARDGGFEIGLTIRPDLCPRPRRPVVAPRLQLAV